jgi:hypothetical protein
MSGIKSLAREPLVHFLIAGAALFALNGLYGGEDAQDRSISIDEEQVARLAGQWQQQWRRQPSPKELDGLIRDHIKDEIYYREAMRLRLDIDDPVIRRRLRSKMEFLASAQAENTPPTEAELARYYAANNARYASDPVYGFDQLYFGDDEAAARRAVTLLNDGKTLTARAISLPAGMEKAGASEIGKLFGDDFTESLRALPVGRWSGPVQSGFGLHAVRIRAATASRVAPLTEISQRVTNDWRAETRLKREAAAYQALLDGYDIRIEKP